MTQQQNKNGGFVNLKKIHDIQVGGSVQALIRDLRSTRIQLDHIVSEAKNLLQSKRVKVVEKEVEKPIEQKVEEKVVAKPVYENRQNFSPRETRFEKHDFEKRDFKKQPFSKDQPRQFGQGGKSFEKKPFDNQQFNKPFNRDGQKQGAGFASSKGNNFRSFAAPDIVIPETNRRFDNNKNKTQTRDLDERKQPTKRNQQQSYKNVLVNDSDGFEEMRMGSRKLIKTKKEKQETFVAPVIDHAVVTSENISVKTLSEKTGKPATEIIKKLMILGIMANINSTIDYETAELVASELGITLELKLEKSFEEKLLEQTTSESSENLVVRPPVVTVMGHVDHGKTSLLDAIRKTNVVSGEAGGITQKIGAYSIVANGQKITFIDTPGHAAFTSMRARGAKITDIAILVVAADDGLMPQTEEAINHIKAANVPMIVAINKMDKPEANPERVKQQLAEKGILPEEWGGDTIFVPISAKQGTGIDKLLETILLVAEVQELKADPSRMATGVVIEAELDKNRGPVASVLVQNGTLRVGDNVVCGLTYGKVRALYDEKGKAVKEAGPSICVSVLGFNEVPSSGDAVVAIDEKFSKQVIEERKAKIKLEKASSTSGVSLDDFMSKVNEGKLKALNILIKADVQGSVEALRQTLTTIRNDEVKVVCIHSGVGFVTESDVILAKASDAVIIAFNVKTGPKASQLAKTEKVEIKDYSIIYEVVDDLTAAITGMQTIKYQQVVIGHGEVRAMFKLSTSGYIVGTYVTDGKVTRNSFVRVYRGDELVCENQLESLKIAKDDKSEVQKGYECGIKIGDANLVKVDDRLEFYVNEPIKNK
ncbi:MAG: translation initiation factor IF-2 [Firmicutes bacterium]|nr:translation initiation factor IF-2 [Bacillota bacterium]